MLVPTLNPGQRRIKNSNICIGIIAHTKLGLDFIQASLVGIKGKRRRAFVNRVAWVGFISIVGMHKVERDVHSRVDTFSL